MLTARILSVETDSSTSEAMKISWKEQYVLLQSMRVYPIHMTDEECPTF